MQNKKIFLASSAELKDDREQFEIFINRKNKDWVNKGIFLELVIWEDFLDAMSRTRLQDEYNKAVVEADIFVILFFTKVGKYTAEEFEKAFRHFQETNKPFIFTYCKNAPVSSGELNDNVLSLLEFKKKLQQLGHFYTIYENINELKDKFNRQLDKLATSGFIKLEHEQDSQSTATAQVSQVHYGTGDNVAGSKIISSVPPAGDK